MKQNITQQDLLQLNEHQIKALFTYWWETPPIKKNPNTPYARVEYSTGYLLDLPLLSIGDMIQYLATKGVWLHVCQSCEGHFHITNNYNEEEWYSEELCDGLWVFTENYLNK